MKSAIVEPLGLNATGPDLDATGRRLLASGYGVELFGGARQVFEHSDTGDLAAATGFYSTATDLCSYFAGHFLGNSVLLSDTSKRHMQQYSSKLEGAQEKYGLGLAHYSREGWNVYGHNGGFPGFLTSTQFDSGKALVVSVLTNASDGPAEQICTGVLNLIAGFQRAGGSEGDARVAGASPDASSPAGAFWTSSGSGRSSSRSIHCGGARMRPRRHGGAWRTPTSCPGGRDDAEDRARTRPWIPGRNRPLRVRRRRHGTVDHLCRDHDGAVGRGRSARLVRRRTVTLAEKRSRCGPRALGPRTEDLDRGRDALLDRLERHPLVRGVHPAVGQREPAQHCGNPAFRQRADHRQRCTPADEQSDAPPLVPRPPGELNRRSRVVDQGRSTRVRSSISMSAPAARRLAPAARTRHRSLADPGLAPGGSRRSRAPPRAGRS